VKPSNSQDSVDRAGLRSGLVLRRSLRILRTRFRFWLAIGLIACAFAVPVVVPVVIFLQAYSDVIDPGVAVWLYFPIVAPFQPIIVYAAFRAWCEEDFLFGEALQHGRRRILPVFGIFALMLLAAALGFAVVFALVWILRSLIGFADSAGVVFPLAATTLVAVLIFLPAATTGMVRTSVAIPACIIDGFGPFASLRRSFQLTKGHFGTIFAAFLSVPIGVFLCQTILAAAGLVVIMSLSDNFYLIVPLALLYYLAVLLLLWLAPAFFTILSTSIYANLRPGRGGPAADRIADIFN